MSNQTNDNQLQRDVVLDKLWAERVEKKLDDMAEAIVVMARVEEKITSLETRRSENHERMNRLSAKIDENRDTIHAIKEKVTLMWSITIFAATSFAGAIFTHYYLQ